MQHSVKGLGGVSFWQNELKIFDRKGAKNQHEEIFCAVVYGGNVIADVCGKRQSGSR
jgi:hypothetical protein